jgi:hypothetical protein
MAGLGTVPNVENGSFHRVNDLLETGSIKSPDERNRTTAGGISGANSFPRWRGLVFYPDGNL